MKKLVIVVATLVLAVPAMADTFASGTANEFTIDFVPISGDAGDLGSWAAGSGYIFSGVNHGDYRMGTYEITNDQFSKFAANSNVHWTGADVPSNLVSWFEAAQFVNYLNTSTGNQAAYKFSDSTFSVWAPGDTGYDASNPYRNSDAYYFLPTEDEWLKAAYWNGTNLQTWATVGDIVPVQGDGVSGTGWNFYDNGYATDPGGPWDVGSGSEELNGTFDMMGNVWEWNESPYPSGEYLSDPGRGILGGSYDHFGSRFLSSSAPLGNRISDGGLNSIGFRVASVPEPASLVLIGLGGLLVRKRK